MADLVVGIESSTGQRWVWKFPGTKRELTNEWLDGYAPLHLMPGGKMKKKDYLGPVEEVDALPDRCDAKIRLSTPTESVLEIGNEEHHLEF
jgi:hypothetical protein